MRLADENSWNRTCTIGSAYDAELPIKQSGRTTNSICDRHRGADWTIAPKPSSETHWHASLASGTAAAPNYGEARAAESRADFIHKLKIALKELNETAIWLRIIQGSFELNTELLNKLVAENTELCRIFCPAFPHRAV